MSLLCAPGSLTRLNLRPIQQDQGVGHGDDVVVARLALAVYFVRDFDADAVVGGCGSCQSRRGCRDGRDDRRELHFGGVFRMVSD